MSIRPLFFVAIAALVAPGCGTDGPGTGPITAADAEAGCRADCEHDETCSPGGETVDECIADCVGDVAGWVRADVFEAITDCMAGLACGVSDDQCLAECQPTSTHEAYEAQCREVFAACGTADQINGICETTPSLTNEVGLYCLIAPSIIDEMIACIPDGTTCQAGSACIQAVLESHQIDA